MTDFIKTFDWRFWWHEDAQVWMAERNEPFQGSKDRHVCHDAVGDLMDTIDDMNRAVERAEYQRDGLAAVIEAIRKAVN